MMDVNQCVAAYHMQVVLSKDQDCNLVVELLAQPTTQVKVAYLLIIGNDVQFTVLKPQGHKKLQNILSIQIVDEFVRKHP